MVKWRYLCTRVVILFPASMYALASKWGNHPLRRTIDDLDQLMIQTLCSSMLRLRRQVWSSSISRRAERGTHTNPSRGKWKSDLAVQIRHRNWNFGSRGKPPGIHHMREQEVWMDDSVHPREGSALFVRGRQPM